MLSFLVTLTGVVETIEALKPIQPDDTIHALSSGPSSFQFNYDAPGTKVKWHQIPVNGQLSTSMLNYLCATKEDVVRYLQSQSWPQKSKTKFVFTAAETAHVNAEMCQQQLAEKYGDRLDIPAGVVGKNSPAFSIPIAGLDAALTKALTTKDGFHNLMRTVQGGKFAGMIAKSLSQAIPAAKLQDAAKSEKMVVQQMADAGLKFPIILKPTMGSGGNLNPNKIYPIVKSPGTLRQELGEFARMWPGSPAVVSEYVQKPNKADKREYVLYCVFDKRTGDFVGKPAELLARGDKKLGGREIVNTPAALLNRFRELLRGIGFHGIANVQYVRKTTGELGFTAANDWGIRIFEINPRVGGAQKYQEYEASMPWPKWQRAWLDLYAREKLPVRRARINDGSVSGDPSKEKRCSVCLIVTLVTAGVVLLAVVVAVWFMCLSEKQIESEDFEY